MTVSILAAAVVAVMLAAPFTVTGSPDRRLLQNGACQSYAQSLATNCGPLLVLVQSDASLNGASDAQLEAAIGGHKPSPTCCTSISLTLSNGCRCDSSVIQLAQGLGIAPSQFYTIGRAGVLACGLPTNTDTAPNPCPASAAAGK